MKLVYVAGKYRDKTPFRVAANIRLAAEVALRYWQRGYAVICPHMNTAFFDGEAEDSVWLAGDLEMILRCDMVVMLPNWRDSHGAMVEHNVAISERKEIIYEECGCHAANQSNCWYITPAFGSGCRESHFLGLPADAQDAGSDLGDGTLGT